MFVRLLQAIPLPQADQPEGQQAAKLGAALCGRHLVGRERIGAFHAADRSARPRTAAVIAPRFQRKFRWQLAAYFDRLKSSPLAS